jgi:alpha-galactosidase/6-phospho-beta-glucosidase family protein
MYARENTMKIVAIGAGSFVFGPTLLLDAIHKHRVARSELVLVDLDAQMAEIMAGIGRRMARELDVDCRITATTDRHVALKGADFCTLSASPQGAQRWRVDYEILKRAGMPDQARECGGLGGLSNALRSISLALDVCRDMEDLCPQAILLDVTNPMPRVVTAVNRFTGIRVYGFCNAAWRGATGYEWLARLTGRPQDGIRVVTAGLNHFAWLISIHDRATGQDLYPLVEQAVCQGEGSEFKLFRKWLDRYGAISAVGGHASEYLPFDPDAHYATRPPYHGSAEKRQQHRRKLQAIAQGRGKWQDAFTQLSWEHPIDVAVALGNKAPLDVDMINLPNDGYLSELPPARIVEVPARIQDGKLTGVSVGPLPGRTGELCKTLSDVHELVAQGAAQGKRDLLIRAIEIDLAIADKATAIQVLDEMLDAHSDMLPQFRT